MRPALLLRGIRAVAVDLDGTMVDTLLDFHAAVNRMRDGLGLAALDSATIARFVGRGSEHLMRQVLALDFDEVGVAHHLDAAMSNYLGHYRQLNGTHAKLYPGVLDGLDMLRAAGLRLACVTNKPYDFADQLLRQCGLNDYFELLVGGDSLAARKPDPLPLQHVCVQFDVPPAALLMIGDSINDARAARAAGCPVLLLPYGYNHGEDIQCVDSDGIVLSLQQAASLIA